MESEKTAPTYLTPLHQKLKLRLDDVIINRNGEVRVIVTADPATTHTVKNLLESKLRGVRIEPLGDHKFSITHQMPTIDHPSSVTPENELISSAITMVKQLAQIAKLNLGISIYAAKAEIDGKEKIAVTLFRKNSEHTTDHFRFILANVLLDRMEESEEFKKLKLHNPRDGIETETANTHGGMNYITCDLIALNQDYHVRKVRQLTTQVATFLGISAPFEQAR